MIRIVCNTLIILVLVTILVLVAILGIPLLSGKKLYTVRTTSMQPAYPVNSIVVVKPVPPSEIQVGDAITFRSGSTGKLVTHRVIEVDQQAHRFSTKGDNNEQADPDPVPDTTVIGRVEYSIPVLGSISELLKSVHGKVIAGVLLFLLLLLFLLPDIFGSGSSSGKKKKTASSDPPSARQLQIQQEVPRTPAPTRANPSPKPARPSSYSDSDIPDGTIEIVLRKTRPPQSQPIVPINRASQTPATPLTPPPVASKPPVAKPAVPSASALFEDSREAEKNPFNHDSPFADMPPFHEDSGVDKF